MTRTFSTIAGLRCFLAARPSIGFVPTMGALHDGHLSLIRRARAENECVAVSIFVNPLQFGPQEDFAAYPRDLDRDRQLCEQAGVDVLFLPTAAELLGAPQLDDRTQVLPPAGMMATLCGRSRPGHFPGVATIVTKLLQIVRPHRAYFGQKDGQQVAIVRRVVADLNIPTAIVACPTVREPDGLACSSRNRYLSVSERAAATALYRGLQRAASALAAGERSAAALIEKARAALAESSLVAVEYVELVHPISLEPVARIDNEAAMLAIAARVGRARLIDNMLLHARKPIIAIDGPAGAGKSTVARLVAHRLGLLYFDTGAMYRAMTLAALQAGIDLEDAAAIAEVASQATLALQPTPDADRPAQVWLNGRDVTQDIRSQEVTERVSTVASHAAVRELLVVQQQRLGQGGGVVMEGRDIGTKVFPQAEIKVFLTASPRERAMRRQRDLLAQGETDIDLDAIEASIRDRDRRDSTRTLSPLRQADDAIAILTDNLTIEDVVDRIVELYARCSDRQLIRM